MYSNTDLDRQLYVTKLFFFLYPLLMKQKTNISLKLNEQIDYNSAKIIYSCQVTLLSFCLYFPFKLLFILTGLF